MPPVGPLEPSAQKRSAAAARVLEAALLKHSSFIGFILKSNNFFAAALRRACLRNPDGCDTATCTAAANFGFGRAKAQQRHAKDGRH